MNTKIKLFSDIVYSQTKKTNKSNYIKKFYNKLFATNNIYKILSICILASGFCYFTYFYINNNSDYYVQISKGLVFPKSQLASLPLVFE